jgi:hypothetical protein
MSELLQQSGASLIITIIHQLDPEELIYTLTCKDNQMALYSAQKCYIYTECVLDLS